MSEKLKIETIIWEYLETNYSPNLPDAECITLSTAEIFANLMSAFPDSELTPNLIVQILDELGFKPREMGVMQPEWVLYVRTPLVSFSS